MTNNLTTLTDSNIFGSFSGTTPTTSVISLPDGTYRGMNLVIDYTLTSADPFDVGTINNLFDTVELKIAGVTQWRLRSGQLHRFAQLCAIRQQDGENVFAHGQDLGAANIATTSVYSDETPTTATAQRASFFLMAGYIAASDVTLEITVDPGNLTGVTLSALSMSINIGMIPSGPSAVTTTTCDIREETSEVRNDITTTSPIDMIYIDTSTANDLTRVEAPGVNITNPVIYTSTFAYASGVKMQTTTKSYLIYGAFRAGQLSVTGNTAESRTIFLFDAPSSASNRTIAVTVPSRSGNALASVAVPSAVGQSGAIDRVRSLAPRSRLSGSMNRSNMLGGFLSRRGF
jgi:hypothetical protein